KLRAFLHERLDGAFDVTHEWSGTLFDTSDGLPYIAEHPYYRGRVFVATGFGGNGMVMGTMAGRVPGALSTRTPTPAASLFDFTRTGAQIRKPGTAAADGDAPPAFVSAAKSAGLGSTPMCVEVKGRPIALFRIGGAIYAIDNECSHAG